MSSFLTARSPVRLIVLAGLSILASHGQASTCATSISPAVIITSPGGDYVTENTTVDLKGEVTGLCALADLGCGIAAERITVRSQFLEGERVWNFECIGVQLELADDDNTLVNHIAVTASGFDAASSSVSVDSAIDVIQRSPPNVEPPGDGGLPVRDVYTKSKVTWNHRNDTNPYYDAFSTNSRLGSADGQPLQHPCATGDSLTVTLYASGVAQPLYTESFTGDDWGTCTDTRLRKTGPPGGIREISFNRRSDGDDTFYVYLERVEYGPSDMDFVRDIDSYLLHIAMSTSGQTAEWNVEVGPDCLNFEEFYSGTGGEVRTVVRCNR